MKQEFGSSGRRDERGMALVIALLVLLSLTVLGTALMMTVNIEGKIAGHQLRDTQALNIAEAGVNEAMVRIQNGEVPADLNPRMVTLIYEEEAGFIPVSGADTTSLPTLQDAGAYLGYSSSAKDYAQGSGTDLDVLAVKYKTVIVPGAPPDTLVVRYDDGATPKLNTTSGAPIYTVTAVGHKGNASRGVVADVTTETFNIFSRAAVAAEVAIQFKGNIAVCGHDHRGDTPEGTQPPACNVGIGTWWSSTVHGDCLPGSWSESIIDEQGSPTLIGEPGAKTAGQTGFYSGPWDAIGLPQAEFWNWVGSPIAIGPDPPVGVLYLDNNSTLQDQSGSYFYTGGMGEGLLYIDGDLTINGNFSYKGLLYIEGNLVITGDAWILGGLIVRGKNVVKIANGSAVILYSSEAIQQSLQTHGGRLRTIAWREF
jgi:Tfp pilus assembly protein PilX